MATALQMQASCNEREYIWSDIKSWAAGKKEPVFVSSIGCAAARIPTPHPLTGDLPVCPYNLTNNPPNLSRLNLTTPSSSGTFIPPILMFYLPLKLASLWLWQVPAVKESLQHIRTVSAPDIDKWVQFHFKVSRLRISSCPGEIAWAWAILATAASQPLSFRPYFPCHAFRRLISFVNVVDSTYNFPHLRKSHVSPWTELSVCLHWLIGPHTPIFVFSVAIFAPQFPPCAAICLIDVQQKTF